MKRSVFSLATFAILLMIGLPPLAVKAANITWTGNVSTAWSTGANWVGNVAPSNNTTSDKAVFSGDPTGVNQPHIGSGRSVDGVSFDSGGWTIGADSLTTSLTLGDIGLDSIGAGVNTVNAKVVCSAGGTWSIAGGSALVVNGAVTWTSAPQFTGSGTAGTVTFNATGTGGDGITFTSTGGGVPGIRLGANDALGTGDLAVNNSTVFTATNGLRTLNNAVDHNVTGGTITFTGDSFTLKKKITIGGGGGGTTPRTISVGSNCTATANAGIDTVGKRFVKTGSGTLVLLGTSSMNTNSASTDNSSAMIVSNGTLRINGTVSSSNGAGGSVTVDQGCTLGGTGKVSLVSNRTVTVNGTLAPGNPAANSGVGTLTIGTLAATNNLSLGTNSQFEAQINGATAGTAYDQVALFGRLTLSASDPGCDLAVTLGYDPNVSDTFVLVSRGDDGPISGVFKRLNGVATGLSEGAVFPLVNSSTGHFFRFRISYAGGDGNDVTLTVVGIPTDGTIISVY